MARITVEDCLTKENNRFALVQLAAKRTKQILGGAKALVASSNKAVVTALREIADSKVRFMTPAEAEEARAIEEAEKQAIFDQPAPIAIAANIAEILGVDDSDDDEDIEDIDDEDDADDLDDSEDGEDDSKDDDESDKDEEKKDAPSDADLNGDHGSES